MKNILNSLDKKKAVPPGDIQTKILKHFASEISTPVTNVINYAIKRGVWPGMFKTEFIRPVPKVYPPKKLKNLSSISGLMTIDKVFEKLLEELIIRHVTNIQSLHKKCTRTVFYSMWLFPSKTQHQRAGESPKSSYKNNLRKQL